VGTPNAPARRVVLVFLDGVGIGTDDPEVNPFFQAELLWLKELLGGLPSLSTPRLSGPAGQGFPIDARLGMDGIPQSGTGQVSLLTGHNGATLFGRHFGPWTPVALRPVLAESNLLVRALDRGLPATFANAYPRGWPGSLSTRRQAAPPLAALAAGLLTRHAEHLARGEAVSSEIVNGPWRRHLGPDHLPDVTPAGAGGALARIAEGASLTLYAHYATDYAGHRGGMRGAIRALERVDAFLAGLAEGIRGQSTTVLVVSDHGNIEDTRGGHTLNPVLGLTFGVHAEALGREISTLTDVPGAILGFLAESGDAVDPGANGP
jgi:hypothetical protein